MNDTQIVTFLTVAECLSFTEASYRLYTAQSAVSRTISTMEQELGYPLFVRFHKEIRLTPAGAVLQEGLEKLYQAYKDLTKQAERASNYAVGTLAIGFLEGQHLEPDTQNILFNMERDYPKMKTFILRASYGPLIEDLKQERLDVIFTMNFSIQDTPDIFCVPAKRLKHFLLVHNKHPLVKTGQAASLSDFQSDYFISINPGDCPHMTDLITGTCMQAGFQPKILEAKDLSEALLWVEAGKGLGIFNEQFAACHSPMLKVLSFPELPECDMVLAWNQKNPNPLIPNLIQRVSFEAGRQ